MVLADFPRVSGANANGNDVILAYWGNSVELTELELEKGGRVWTVMDKIPFQTPTS
jgi:hypothetical protein